jgi:hypothetical protein
MCSYPITPVVHVGLTFFAKGTVLFKHTEPPEGGQIRTMHARQLEAFRCFLSTPEEPLASNPSAVNLAEPTDVTLVHEWLPETLREKWSLQIEPMNFTISYHDFRMLSLLFAYWFPSSTAPPQVGKQVLLSICA